MIGELFIVAPQLLLKSCPVGLYELSMARTFEQDPGAFEKDPGAYTFDLLGHANVCCAQKGDVTFLVSDHLIDYQKPAPRLCMAPPWRMDMNLALGRCICLCKESNSKSCALIE